MKKLLSLMLTLIMIMSVVPMNAFAEEASLQEINGANIYFDTDKLVGKTREDLFDIISINTPGLELDRENLKINGTTQSNCVFEYATVYTVGFKLYPAEGYTLSKNRPELQSATIVEGRKSIRPNDQNSVAPTVNVRYIEPGCDEECISVSFRFRPTGPMNVLKQIDISFDNALNGKTTADYKSFISFNTDGVELGNEKFWACIGYPSAPGCEYVDVFEPGETYYSTIYIYPKDGYAFSTQTKININGSSVRVDSCEYDFSDKSTNDCCNYVKVLFHYTVPEIELTSTEKFFKSISDFFTSISDFFTELFVDFFAVLNELFTGF